MIRKVFKKISWKYALGEILLIFIGITAAIWFNNWNESQKSQKIEIRSLQEVANAVNQDLEDIEENIFGFTQRVKLYSLLMEHMEKDIPLTEELEKRLPFFMGTSIFFSNSGPYETLKSRGMEIIANDSIRLEISLYYDFEYEKIQSSEKEHYQHFQDYIKPTLMLNFEFINHKPVPLDYEKLMNDFEFKQTIYWALVTDSYMLSLYENLKQKGISLRENLNAEITRLKS
ncbi:hypothetical protein J0X14_10630 [Muricauda sp. CAU 1633]|uniref:DUF6090 family protein n=1 Tax=Allomuricauda sp. CAU 1633 TaxID=2816036 RepID=UPI001A8E164C|nr:DUF6090 family protein [Muricauda sp. CAU 1633]MBO0322753.1 hypothetical protein [Muricauda sp. CAU 1633]